MLEDIFSGLLETVGEFLLEMAGEIVSDVLSAVGDALSGGQSHRHEGVPAERLRLPPRDFDGSGSS